MARNEFVFTHSSGTKYDDAVLTAAGTLTGDWMDAGVEHELTIVFKSVNNDTDAGDTCDAYIDGRFPDGTTVNLIHFPQVTGTTADVAYAATLTRAIAAATIVDVTSDAAANVIRALGFPLKLKARVVTVNTSTNDETFTVSISASGR